MDKKELNKGYIYTTLCFLIWGTLTIYWKQLVILTALEILAARVLFSIITLLIVVHIMKKPIYRDYLKDKKQRRRLIISGIIIGINWGVFIYAVNSGNVLQASLGYYINPLISVLLGVVVLKERLLKAQYIAVIFASVGLLYMVMSYGQFPWISLIIALSFGLYGLLKKIYHLDSLNSLLVEALVIAPIIISLVVIDSISNGSRLGEASLYEWAFIVFAGVVTIIPLMFFAEGAKRIPLSSVGFLQYITPTMFLFVGVILYKEVFTISHGVSFGFIWIGLIINFASTLRKQQKLLSETI